VTAQVGKQIGVMSAGGGQNRTTEQTKIHQPTLLHKRIYEKNLTVNNNVRIFFKGLFDRSLQELSRINGDCVTTAGYLDTSADQLQRSVENSKQIEESLHQLCDSLARSNLPGKYK